MEVKEEIAVEGFRCGIRWNQSWVEPNFHGGRREGNVEEGTPGKGAEPKLDGTKVDGHGDVAGWERRGT